MGEIFRVMNDDNKSRGSYLTAERFFSFLHLGRPLWVRRKSPAAIKTRPSSFPIMIQANPKSPQRLIQTRGEKHIEGEASVLVKLDICEIRVSSSLIIHHSVSGHRLPTAAQLRAFHVAFMCSRCCRLEKEQEIVRWIMHERIARTWLRFSTDHFIEPTLERNDKIPLRSSLATRFGIQIANPFPPPDIWRGKYLKSDLCESKTESHFTSKI